MVSHRKDGGKLKAFSGRGFSTMREALSRYQPKDSGYHRAKRAGYRSRAALKLEEVDHRFGLLRPGLAVLDLGCWPGGWTQVASARVGESGRVVCVDMEKVEPFAAANIVLVAGDVSDPGVQRILAEGLGRPADLVMSDMAPKLSGIASADRARHETLVGVAVDLADRFLGTGGGLLVKLFSDSEAWFRKRVEGRFERTATFRPASTRKGSSEIYGLALGRVGAPEDPEP